MGSAAAQSGHGDDGTMHSSDWLAERQVDAGGGAAAANQAPSASGAPAPVGVPVTSPKRDTARSGRSRESRRGSHY